VVLKGPPVVHGVVEVRAATSCTAPSLLKHLAFKEMV
jgi:hypothetical protein